MHVEIKRKAKLHRDTTIYGKNGKAKLGSNQVQRKHGDVGKQAASKPKNVRELYAG